MPNLRTPWRCVSAAFALNGLLLGTWAARVPGVMEKHDLTKSELGLYLLLMGVGALISFPLAGRLADSRGAVRVTRWIAVIYLLSLIVVGVAPGHVMLGVGLFFFGMCHGSMDVTMNSWATEVEKHMGRSVMSSFHAMWSLGAGLGAASGFLATGLNLSIAVHFAVLSVAGGLLFGPFIAAQWDSQRRAATKGGPVFAMPRGALALVGLVALAAGIGEGAMADWSAVYLRDVVATGESQATLGYAVFSVTMVAMRLCVDQLVIRLGPVTVARLSGLIAATGLAFVTVYPSLPLALAGFVMMGMGYAALIPLAFSRAAADPDVPPGQAIASVATLGYGAMMIGPPAIGFVADIWSLRAAFVMLGGFALMVAFMAPVLSRRQSVEVVA